MAEEPQRVRVDAVYDPFFLGDADRTREDLVAAPPRFELAGEDVLPAVAGAQRVAQPLRNAGFSQPQHVTHLLRVGAQPQVADADVGVQHVAALDHDPALAEERGVALVHRAFALDVDVGLKPRVEPEVLEALADVPGDVVGGGHARRDDVFGERLGDDPPRQRDDVRINLHLTRRARFHPADHEVLGALRSLAKLRRQGFHQAIAQRSRQAVGERPVAADVDPDLFGVELGEQFAEPFPLRVEIAAFPHRFVKVAHRIAAHRHALDAVFAAVVEHQHRRAPRREHRLGDQRQVDRVLGVLAVDHEPQVDARLAHQARQQIVQSLGQVAVDRFDALPVLFDGGHAVQHAALVGMVRGTRR